MEIHPRQAAFRVGVGPGHRDQTSMTQRKLLIVGGGIAGMSLAIRMRGIGWEVDLVEIDPQWRVYGAESASPRPPIEPAGA